MDAKRIAELRELYEKAANALPIATIALGLIARTALPEALDAYEDLQELHELACNSDNAWREKAEALQKELACSNKLCPKTSPHNKEWCDNQLQAELTKLKEERDGWYVQWQLEVKEVTKLREALEEISKVDVPSASDKTAWIVMLESVVAHARKALESTSSNGNEE